MDVTKKLESLRTDSAFSNVDPSVSTKIIDTAIDTVKKIGSQRMADFATRAVALGAVLSLFTPLAVALFPLAFVILEGAEEVNSRTNAKNKVYDETVSLLQRYNRIPDKAQQREQFNRQISRSAVRDIVPPATMRPSVAPATGAGQSVTDLVFNRVRDPYGLTRPERRASRTTFDPVLTRQEEEERPGRSFAPAPK